MQKVHYHSDIILSISARSAPRSKLRFKWLWRSHFSADLHQIWYRTYMYLYYHTKITTGFDGMEFPYGLTVLFVVVVVVVVVFLTERRVVNHV